MNIFVIINILVFSGIVFLVFLNFIQERKFHRAGIDTRGSLPVNRLLFAAAKIGMLVTWMGLLFQSAGNNLRFVELNLYTQLIALTFEITGVLFIFFAYIKLGEANTMGLPLAATVLKSSGIFSVSRNPLYLGFHLISVSSVIFTANPVIAGAALLSFVGHHRIILAEEAFLENRFGDDYTRYKKKTRRYF